MTTGRHNFAMITDRQKFNTKITLYGISSFQNNPLWNFWFSFLLFESIQSQLQSVHEMYSKFFFGHVACGLTTRQITLSSLDHRQPITIDY